MATSKSPAPRHPGISRGRSTPSEPLVFQRPPVDRPRLRGSAQILGHLRVRYDGADGLPSGTLVSLLLDRHSSVLGLARLRAMDSPGRRALEDQVHLLLEHQATDPRAAAGFASLLVAYRSGPSRLLDADRWLWSALRAACHAAALHPADVLVSTPAGWFTVRAGTSGQPEPTLRLQPADLAAQNGMLTNGEE